MDELERQELEYIRASARILLQGLSGNDPQAAIAREKIQREFQELEVSAVKAIDMLSIHPLFEHMPEVQALHVCNTKNFVLRWYFPQDLCIWYLESNSCERDRIMYADLQRVLSKTP